LNVKLKSNYSTTISEACRLLAYTSVAVQQVNIARTNHVQSNSVSIFVKSGHSYDILARSIRTGDCT